MFTEYKDVRQDKTGYRRLFQDHDCDLYLWYENKASKKLTGFQIVYKSKIDSKALTWTEDEGFFHLKVDEKKWGGLTPFLIVDGEFEYENVKSIIYNNIQVITDEEVKYCLVKIKHYGEKTEI